MGAHVLEVVVGFIALVVTLGVAPVVINKTTDIHFDWIKPRLREWWTGLFIFFSLVYLLTSQVKEVAMKLHGSFPEGTGYLVCSLLGAIIFSAFWWFTGKALTPQAAAEPLKTSKPAQPTSLPAHIPRTVTGHKQHSEGTNSPNIIGSGNQVNIYPPVAAPVLPVEDVRLVQTREIPSTLESAPFGIELSFQTTVPLQPVTLTITCTQPIAHVGFSPSENYTGMIAGYAVPQGANPDVRLDDPRLALVHLENPAFIPEHALIVRIFSKTKTACVKFSYKAGHPR